ncbi:MAG: glycosyltransferase [Patescibacteria group bacterium]|nr:glycosyltransferase [Patescibacteria group bacterium]
MVSVIINTRNEAKNIESCLLSIKSQKTDVPVEIIVIDNGSRDTTANLASQLGARVYNFGPERSEQKNFGAQKASFDYLLFLDADMELSGAVIDESISEIGRGYGALVVPEVSRGEGFWAACKALEKRFYFNDSLIEAPRFFIKKVFLEVGGYSPGMVAGEDWDLRNKLVRHGVRIGRIKALVFHNEGRLALSAILRKKYYYASKSMEFVSANRPGLKGVFLFVLRPAFIRNLKYAVYDPIHFFGLITLKILEFTFGVVGLIKARFL